MKPRLHVSEEGFHTLAEWVRTHCPCALEDREFLRGLLFIVDEEIERALGRERERLLGGAADGPGRN
jgi:hypothetical protein